MPVLTLDGRLFVGARWASVAEDLEGGLAALVAAWEQVVSRNEMQRLICTSDLRGAVRRMRGIVREVGLEIISVGRVGFSLQRSMRIPASTGQRLPD